jgi:hypothetical protein
MKNWIIKNNKVKVGVTEDCGFLDPVIFYLKEKEISPLNIAPWQNEKLDSSIPPMLRNLRNDFFCAPFGDSDFLEGEASAHGATANDRWNEIIITNNKIELELSKKIMGAKVKKIISIVEDHSVVYEEHIFEGGSGKIPVGHHLMLKVEEQILLNFSDWIYGGTPPFTIEPNPEMGNSLLFYPQEFKSLNKVKLANGEFTDLTKYPTLKNSEDLLMLISDETLPFAWSTATAPKSGWLFFALKSPRVLRNTVLWLSNGGRFYSPFSGRHKNVIGIEETTSFFHLGHIASINKNFLLNKGYKTFIELDNTRYKIRYLFGFISVPNNFSRVNSVEPFIDGINIIDENGIKVFTKVNLNFIYENEKEK